MDFSKLDINKIPPEMIQQFLQGNKQNNPSGQQDEPYKINDIDKMSYAKNSQEYILKIDSKDRNVNKNLTLLI